MLKKNGHVHYICLLAAILILMVPGTALQAKIKLSASSKTLTVGEKLTLKVKGTKKKVKVTWKSSKKSVATVSKKGVVKAKKAGTAKITAKIKGKGIKVTRTCKIKVIKKKSYEKAAKALSNYVVKKGSREEDSKYHLITIEYPEDESSQTTEIYVKKGSTKLYFLYNYNSDTPQFAQRVLMVVDPAKKVLGAVTYSGNLDSYTDDTVTIEGEMTAAYDGAETGLTWTKSDFYYMDDEEATPSPEEEGKYRQKASAYTKEAMEAWQKLMKKADVTWKDLGFTAYK